MTTRSPIQERIQAFHEAWTALAPDASFGGMTLAEFDAAVQPSLDRRQELRELERETAGKRAQVSQADEFSTGILELVINSVRGTPGYGSDCALYQALGYTRKSERRSGLTRKSTGGNDTAADAA